MKRFLLSFALAFAALFAHGQSFSNLWYHDAVQNGLVNLATAAGTTSRVNSGLAYNPVTGNIYVAERGEEIYIVNPNDYTSGSLNSTAFDLSTKKLARPTAGANAMTESARFYKVKVTSKGVIYSIAMQLNGLIYIYKWLNVTDVNPKKYLIQDASILGNYRVGDSFAVFEDNKGDADPANDEVFLYTAGGVVTTGSAPNIVTVYTGQYLFVMKDDAKTDGTSVGPSFVSTIDMEPAKYSTTILDIAKGAISVESPNVVWVKSSQVGVQFKRLVLNMATGTLTQHKLYSSPSANYTFGTILNEAGKGFLLSGSSTTVANGALKFALSSFPVFGAEPASLTAIASAETTLPKSTTYTSSTGLGDFAVKKNVDGTTTVYFLVGKNGLGAFKSDIVLPVSLTSFDAALVKGQSTLTWETASETNNKGFEVLRSTDGKDFAKIGFVDSKGQNGNSSAPLSYTYVDRTAKAGTNYYQLNQIDLDGKNELFKEVKSVSVSLNGADVVVFPNPATTYVTVSAGSADYKGVKYELFDASGKKVLSEKATAEQQDISLNKLPASVYFLKISKNNEVQKTVKLVKQ